MGIAITVFVLMWCWLIWEAMNAPVMPDDYDMTNEEIKLWKELNKEEDNEI